MIATSEQMQPEKLSKTAIDSRLRYVIITTTLNDDCKYLELSYAAASQGGGTGNQLFEFILLIEIARTLSSNLEVTIDRVRKDNRVLFGYFIQSISTNVGQ
ncbi:unnamed protein product [Anisakis simplex]|uniref:HNOB domain-containing protein n=1 Tax=Anisakis simplex TaxID=6269 RepID=A0A0M3J3T9_ANISI|nr:unnamed protein product [Anisakis simplex]